MPETLTEFPKEETAKERVKEKIDLVTTKPAEQNVPNKIQEKTKKHQRKIAGGYFLLNERGEPTGEKLPGQLISNKK